MSYYGLIVTFRGMMKALVLKPELVLPWDGGVRHRHFFARAKEEKRNPRPLDVMLKDAEEAMRVIRRIEPGSDKGEGWFYVPLVPVFEAPEDLRHIGDYVVYNGNHRWKAAKEVGIYLPCMLLENDEDLEKVVRRGEGLGIDKSRVPFTYFAHRAEIHRLARKHAEAEANRIKEKPYQRRWRF